MSKFDRRPEYDSGNRLGEKTDGEEGGLSDVRNVDTNKYYKDGGGVPGMTPRSAASGHRRYADEASGDETWTDSPLDDKKLVKGPLLSGDYKNVPLTKYASGGQTSTGFAPRDISPGARRARAAAGMEDPEKYVTDPRRRKQG